MATVLNVGRMGKRDRDRYDSHWHRPAFNHRRSRDYSRRMPFSRSRSREHYRQNLTMKEHLMNRRRKRDRNGSSRSGTSAATASSTIHPSSSANIKHRKRTIHASVDEPANKSQVQQQMLKKRKLNDSSVSNISSSQKSINNKSTHVTFNIVINNDTVKKSFKNEFKQPAINNNIKAKIMAVKKHESDVLIAQKATEQQTNSQTPSFVFFYAFISNSSSRKNFTNFELAVVINVLIYCLSSLLHSYSTKNSISTN